MKQKFNYQCDCQEFKQKPTEDECRGINSRLARKTCRKHATLEQFVVDSLKHTVAPYAIARAGGKSLSESIWHSKQLFLFDFDNKPEEVTPEVGMVSIADAVSVFEQAGLNVAAAWTTYSHTEDQHRYRILLVAKQAVMEIKDSRRFSLAVAGLIRNAGGLVADVQALKPTQMFFAGREVQHLKLQVRVDVDAIIAQAEALGVAIQQITTQNSSVGAECSPQSGQSNEMRDWIKTNNISEIQKRLATCGILPVRNNGVIQVTGGPRGDEHWAAPIRRELGKYNSLGLLSQPIDAIADNIPTAGQCGRKSIIAVDNETLYQLYSMVPLDVFFGIDNKKIHCIFHDDRKPSAQVLCKPTETKFGSIPMYRYYCYGNSCGLPYRSKGRVGPASANLIDIVMFLQGTTKPQALGNR